MLKKKQSEEANNYECKKCRFTCSKKSNYEQHLLTKKHLFNKPKNLSNEENATAISSIYCEYCNKEYKSRVGLWYHNKKCNMTETDFIKNHVFDTSSNEIKVLTNLVLEMVQSNKELQKTNGELQKQLVDVCKNTSTINSHNNHSHNKTFNLQFFLNEQCKDAMNISDFANSFDLQLSDLESVGELGYVEGITKIFVDKLNSMDIYKRPIHCSDAKREILYVKDDNKWEKEERNNPKIRYAIKTISFRNMKLAALWSDTYPESKNCDSYVNERYMKLIKESTGGSGETVENENKIIRRIAKEIVIDKK
jgi:hypothetical protein